MMATQKKRTTGTASRNGTKSGYRGARSRVGLAPGDAVRVARQLRGLSQYALAAAAGLAQPTLSSIETGRITMGAERAERLARVLNVHPGILLFPQWREDERRARRSAKGDVVSTRKANEKAQP